MDNKPEDFLYNHAINLICDQLQALGITSDISCRVKDPYSILDKLTRKSVKFEELTDIVGFRIIAKLTLYYFLSMVKTEILAAAAYSHLKVLTLSDKPSV
jgi:(p)ppGpp synthase/HD superfamily hydrolase